MHSNGTVRFVPLAEAKPSVWTWHDRMVAYMAFVSTVSMVCLLILVIALNQDSQTLNTTAFHANSIMSDFQQSRLLDTAAKLSVDYNGKISNTMEFARVSIIETMTFLRDAVRKANETKLLDRAFAEGSTLLEFVDDTLDRFKKAFAPLR
jgi:hypothetical protein